VEFITPALKDRLLLLLFEKYPRGLWQIDIEFICKELSIDIETLINILECFLQDNLIDDLNARYVAIHVLLNFCSASDFLRQGGYQGREALSKLIFQRLQAEVQKLQLEIQELTKTPPETPAKAISFERAFNFIGNIASIVSLMAK
jgi:hypothetical protein